MDAFLGNRPATQPTVVIDSLADRCTSNADYEASESDSDDNGKPAESTTTTADTGNSTIDVDSSTVSAKPKECPAKGRCSSQATSRCVRRKENDK